ncbi:MAG TPA: hypothetical protein VFW84_02730 [Aquabacterium sp.]|uniref:hypothetical protein n=1 Tax=Aquabacterium sp. TaxID=1872578 RepID=UPI002E35DF18|nr:hypothetical protein [Aquabacterium sp.]HEX5371628.1 hypothetical protein [Aquabacterium sp.]
MPPKPNYSFEKRQRELEKKKKKAEKAMKKASGHDGDTAVSEAQPQPEQAAPSQT